MILLRSKGGLGNQVFQIIYALLNSKDKEAIYVDNSLFKMRFADDYAGMHFLASKVIKKDLNKKIVYFSFGHILSRLFWKFSYPLKSFFKFFNITLLDDYFSDVNFFPLTIEYQKFFDLKYEFNEYKIDDNSVIIHVRKGDYNNSINSQIYYNCEPAYFKKAVELIRAKVPEANFFVMSNDNDWVRKNFTFLDNYRLLEIEDPIISFKLMSQFSYFIISNSTFSWWPAFISKSKNVYVPKKWFLDDTKNKNLYPDNWIKVDV
jgi:hypothetical protein